MSSNIQFKKAFQHIQIVRTPRHRLATFGSSRITYKLITDVNGLTDRSRLRIGEVMAEKPALITPQTLMERFYGFGNEAVELANWLMSQYGETVRGLAYHFRNESSETRIELLPPEELIKKLTEEFDRSDDFSHAIIKGTDKLWELSVMKFIIEETLSSFASNMQELKDRGFFDDSVKVMSRLHLEIKNLFKKATHNKAFIPELGKKLKETNLFDEYQDEFFRLMKT